MENEKRGERGEKGMTPEAKETPLTVSAPALMHIFRAALASASPRVAVGMQIVGLLMWCVCVVRCAQLRGACLIVASAWGSGAASVCIMLY